MFKQLFLISTIFILNSTLLFATNLQYNLLKNADFELGVDDWDASGLGISLTNDSFKGDKAIQYTTGGTGQTSDELPTTDGNRTYIFSGYYKNIGLVDGIWLGATYLDENWSNIGETFIDLNLSTSYKRFELSTKPPKNALYISVWTWSDSKTGGKTLLDDLRLHPEGFEITPCNILQNSSFEQNESIWSIYSASTRLINDAYNGNKAIQISDGGLDQISQPVTGNVGTYQFNGYYKTSNSPEGVWAGMNFYDKDYNLLFSKSIPLENTKSYKKFIVSGTSNQQTTYIQAWIWSSAGESKGEVILDELKIGTNDCYDYVIPSSLPPKGIAIDKAPQFVVIGFDDNTKSDGIEWALDMFSSKKNADGSDARVSFYMNTIGLYEEIEDNTSKLLDAMIALKNSTHEIANHTRNHHRDLNYSNPQNITQLDAAQWHNRIKDASDNLIDKVGILQSDIVGFRAPFLLYNQHMLEELQSQNFLYDCSIEEGYAPEFNGTNFRWPYQLNEGSPGHSEGWYGNPENSEFVKLNPVEGLWEIPNHVFMIPKDNECQKYGIEIGLWSRILENVPYLSDFKITGFDYNLWSVAKLNKAEVLGILKYNLDLRLQGNRAPFMIGAHTQYYTDSWSEANAPNATTTQMREAISEFIDYALSKPEVRVRPGVDIVNWCANPTQIN